MEERTAVDKTGLSGAFAGGTCRVVAGGAIDPVWVVRQFRHQKPSIVITTAVTHPSRNGADNFPTRTSRTRSCVSHQQSVAILSHLLALFDLCQ